MLSSFKTLRTFFVSLCLIFVINPSSFAQPAAKTIPITGISPNAPLTVFDKKFMQFMQHWHIPGSSVTIMKNNEIIISRGYGWADMEAGEPTHPTSLFRVGSVSKAITAVTVLHLIQENKLNFDDKAFYILRDLKPLGDRPARPAIYQISVRQLLQMSSGWSTDRRGDPDPMFGPWTYRMAKMLDYQVPPDCLSAARMMMTMPMQFRPGTNYSYSNINYCLLGLVINRVTGLEGDLGYESYVRQHLLEPNDIYDMQLGESDYASRAPGEVKYYTYEGYDSGKISGLPYSGTNVLRKNYADGGWIASSVDLAKFLQALNYNKILTPQMIDIMATRPIFQQKFNNYFAMGWNVKYLNGHRYLLKTGSFTGTFALIVNKDDGTSYAAVFNTKPPERARFLTQLQNLLYAAA